MKCRPGHSYIYLAEDNGKTGRKNFDPGNTLAATINSEGVYGQGFPKNLSVAKSIDRIDRGATAWGGGDPDSPNYRAYEGMHGNGYRTAEGMFNTQANKAAAREFVRKNPKVRDPVKNAAHHERWQQGNKGNGPPLLELMRRPPADIVPVVSPQARQWEGWHTNLNPAQEPIVVARKPLEGNVARNVLKYGTGALNIGACRVEGKINHSHTTMSDIRGSQSNGGQYILKTHERERLPRPPLTLEQEQAGRYPANFIHDGSEEVLELFESFGKKPGAPYGAIVKRRGGENDMFAKNRKVGQTVGFGRGDTGSAARFFYCAKVSQKDRYGSVHPTVKPVELMRYLVRLVTPPEGLVLDPFAGTGITGEAAHLEGFDYLVIERDPEFVRDIERRLQKYNRAALSVQEPHRDA